MRRSHNGYRLSQTLYQDRRENRHCTYCDERDRTGDESLRTYRSDRPGRREHRLQDGTTQYCTR